LGFGLAYQKTVWKKIGGVWAIEHQKKLGPLRIFATVEASDFKFITQFGFWTSLPKNNGLDQNWRGYAPGEHPQKLGTPTYFLQPLKPATSNLVHKKNVLDQNWRGSGPLEHKKIGTPYAFLQLLKSATSTLVGLAYQKTTFWTKIGGGLG